ncbi:hypothetical protein LZ575_18480 [Antarcticibacterium sp. 1MA-6-2]|uniref:hypothetical protein n=1 Tax=Antarcticibacterium sp. 1MA-6-2 TaxID=2908210 RepID=UPI001F40E743|nr:hypothetical protein [Antarcticibacterium sp. 1MA-6-2]UJH90727.1 hypothetical protein LZ575_18480 [Antarcticibacterium sp. 1MA-6-2]
MLVIELKLSAGITNLVFLSTIKLPLLILIDFGCGIRTRSSFSKDGFSVSSQLIPNKKREIRKYLANFIFIKSVQVWTQVHSPLPPVSL